MIKTSTSKENTKQKNITDTILSFNFSIQVTIDLENYINMSIDLNPFETNQLQDVSTIIKDQVSTPIIIIKVLNQIKEAHSIAKDLNIELFSEGTLQQVRLDQLHNQILNSNYSQNKAEVQDILSNFCLVHSNNKYIVTLINPHYKEEMYSQERMIEGGTSQQIEEVKHSNTNKQDRQVFMAQKFLMQDPSLAGNGVTGSSIIHDTVANKKYKCYHSKCRKSYFTI